MRLQHIVWTTLLIAGAIILTAVISTASVGAQGMETQVPVAPRLLSQTGLYAGGADLKVDKRNRVFSPKYPLWTDGATKRRWVRLPEGSQIDAADLANWELPVGTKFWKEFSVNGRRVETRFLWRTSKDRWVVATYAWNEMQSDGVLTSQSGIANISELADGAASRPALKSTR